jgi:hypothetical protein
MLVVFMSHACIFTHCDLTHTRIIHAHTHIYIHTHTHTHAHTHREREKATEEKTKMRPEVCIRVVYVCV